MISDQSSSISTTHTTRNSRQSNNPFSHAVSASDYMPPSSTSPSQLVQRRRSSTVTKTSQRLRQEAAELTCNVVGPSVDDGTDSENDTIFHDAADDGLMFVDLDLINNGQETEMEIAGIMDSSSANDSESDCSSSSPEEEGDQAETESFIRPPAGDVPNPRQNPSSSSSSTPSSSSSSSSSLSSSSAHNPLQPNSKPNLTSQSPPASSPHLTTHSLILKRRTTLPSPICGDEFSIFSMLKKNVGKVSPHRFTTCWNDSPNSNDSCALYQKDLSQISFPISFNEPLSATQKICEECEYVDELLAKAAQHNCDPLDRLMYIAGFVVSGFCHTKTRAIRKPL